MVKIMDKTENIFFKFVLTSITNWMDLTMPIMKVTTFDILVTNQAKVFFIYRTIFNMIPRFFVKHFHQIIPHGRSII